MPITALEVSERLTGGGEVQDTAASARQSVAYGTAVLPQVRTTYTFGTGDAQANRWYCARRTVAAGAYDDLNLTSGLSTLGAVQAFAALKRVYLGIVGADGSKRLRIGPQGRTNAAQLWFQGVTANFWMETYTSVLMDRPVTGWGVLSGSADVLSVYNPTGASIGYAIWLLGTG